MIIFILIFEKTGICKVLILLVPFIDESYSFVNLNMNICNAWIRNKILLCYESRFNIFHIIFI